MREIVLDTETTGLDPAAGHRIIEIGCVELVNFIPTGRHWQSYVNPERDIPAGAVAVHGITAAILADKPRFLEIADDLLGFIADSPMVIHNADFDLAFLNAELLRNQRAPLARSRAIDTVELARRRFPGAPASLDALCKRFGIDLSGRERHGALIDAGLLARVYLELTSGRQAALGLTAETAAEVTIRQAARPPRPARAHAPSAEEAAAHEAFLAGIAAPVWKH